MEGKGQALRVVGRWGLGGVFLSGSDLVGGGEEGSECLGGLVRGWVAGHTEVCKQVQKGE